MLALVSVAAHRTHRCVGSQVFESTANRHLPVMAGNITQALWAQEREVERVVARISNAVSLNQPVTWPGKHP